MPSDANGHIETRNGAISRDEIALYDRQIRLWGVQAQERIRNARILLLSCGSLANEISKNLVLAGIGSLTIQDDKRISDADLGAQFLIREDELGQMRAERSAAELRKMNPRVKINADIEPLATKSDEYFSSFDMTIATDLTLDRLETVNAACRTANRPFYASTTHGFFGYIFSDLIRHEFVVERERSNKPSAITQETKTRSVLSTTLKQEGSKHIEIVRKAENYCPISKACAAPLPAEHTRTAKRQAQVGPHLSCLRALWEFQKVKENISPGDDHADLELFTMLATKHHQALGLDASTLQSSDIRRFIQNIGSELAPVTAFLGGYLAQDVINVLGQREQPLQNFLIFDGDSTRGPIYSLNSE